MPRYCDVLSRQCRVVFPSGGEPTMPGPSDLAPIAPTLKTLMKCAEEYNSLGDPTPATEFVSWLSLELQLHGFTVTDPPPRRVMTDKDRDRNRAYKQEKRAERKAA